MPPKETAKFLWDYAKSGHVVKHQERYPASYDMAVPQPARKSTGIRYPKKDASPQFSNPVRVASVFDLGSQGTPHEPLQAQELDPLVD